MPVQLTWPGGVAVPLTTPCDVPETVRRVPAQWVRARRTRLAMLVSWPGMVAHNCSAKPLERLHAP